MNVIGITGPICSGKTTASRFFQKKGAQIIDVDAIGHSLLRKRDIKKKVVALFGADILSNRIIDRKKLAKIVFNNKVELEKLCKQLHPQIKKEVCLKIKKSRRKNVIIDASLLIEIGLDKYVDRILVIKVNKDVQLARAKKRGIKEVELKKRIRFQMPIKEFLRHADVVIANNSCNKTFTKHILDNIKNLRYII